MSLLNTKLTSVDRIFTNLKGSIPLENEADIIEWIGDALDAIGVVTQKEEAVCFVKVKNFMAHVPKHCHSIIQIAKNNSYSPLENKYTIRPEDTRRALTLNVKRPITLSGHQGEDTEHDIFSFQYDYNLWFGSELYTKGFSPVRLSENVFFNTMVCKENNYEDIYKNCGDEYTILKGEILKFSFPHGQVAVAYNKHQMDDETGYPLIPENISYISAIVNYCRWQWFTREFYSGREGSESKMNKAESEWIWYCAQAGNTALMLSGVDDYQNFLDQRNYLIPQRRKYFGHFGGLNKAEHRSFNHK